MNRREELRRWIDEQVTAYRLQSDGECEVSERIKALSPEFRRWCEK